MHKLKFFVLFSTNDKPQEISLPSETDRDGDRKLKLRGQYEFEGSLPLPLPTFLVIFALGEWPHDNCCQQMCAQIHLGEDLDPFHIGTLSKDHRAICWQGTWREDLHVRGVLMSDEGQPGLLVITPASPKPTATAQEVCNNQVTLLNATTSIGCQSDKPAHCNKIPQPLRSRKKSNTLLPRVKPTLITDPTVDLETMETSQTESQLMDSAVELAVAQENSRSKIGDTRLTEYGVTADKKTPSRRALRTLRAEMTPEVAAEQSSPPAMSHSGRKKRKSAKDQSTPRGQSRVKRLQMQQSSPSLRTEVSSAPSARWGHSMCAISKKQAVMVGGQGEQQVLSKDGVWLLDTDNVSWCVPGITQGDNNIKPQYRMGHTAVYDPKVKCVYVYGGSKNLRWYSDVHILDVESWRWSLVKATGRAPTRAYHTSTLHNDEMYIFGGVYPNPDPEPDGCSDRLHVFSPALESWYEPLVMGMKPHTRSGHSATLLGDKLIIFGGWDAPECFNDVHCLDLSLMEFTSIPVKGTPPSPRSWHASAALPGNKILIQGGFDGENAMTDSFLFRLDSQCWTKLLWPLHASPAAGHTILTINPWDNLLSDNSNNKENETHADASRQQKLLIFGGGNNEGTFSDKLIIFKLQLPSDS